MMAVVTAGAILAMTSVSCNFRPLIDPDNDLIVDVAINMEGLSNVTCDIYNENIQPPEINTDMMHVMFYNPDTDKLSAETYISDSHMETDENGNEVKVVTGKINIRPGNYKLLIYNFDTESTLIRNHDNFNEVEAYTENVPESLKKLYLEAIEAAKSSAGNGGTKAGDDDDEIKNMVFEPDILMVAKNENEEIPYHTGIHTIKTDASSIVESYYLQIKVDGLKYVSTAHAVLTGVYGSNKFGREDGRIPGYSLYFSLNKAQSPRDDNADVLCCVFNTFGKIPDELNDLYVVFDVKTSYGTTQTHAFEISKKFLEPDCINHKWILIEETIKVEPPPGGDDTGGGGFDPVIEDWEEEIHDVVI